MKALLVCLALAQPALAETAADRFAPKRGFSTDIWVQWQSLTEMLQNPGFLDIFPDYPRHIVPGSFARLHEQGFDTVRIAVDPSPLMALAAKPQEDALLQNLRQRVTEAQAAGLKVILDLHTYPHGHETGDVDSILQNPATFDAYLWIVHRVAETLADFDPDRTALELMNEPTQDCAAIYAAPVNSDWPVKLARLHDMARMAAPLLPLVLSGACWGGAKGLSVLDPAPLHDDNVIWSFHSYEPFTFSHQSAGWTDSPVMFLQGLPWPPDRLTDTRTAKILTEAVQRAGAASGPVAKAATPQALHQLLSEYRALGPADVSAPVAEAVAWADAHGIPHDRLLMGEFGAFWQTGAGKTLDPDSHARLLAAKRQAAEAAGIGWVVWSYSGAFGITDSSGALNPGVCTALGMMKC